MGSLSLNLKLRWESGYAVGIQSNNNYKSVVGVGVGVGVPPRERGGGLRVVKAMAVPKFKGTQMREKQLTEMIEKKVKEAEEVCHGDHISDECKVAWDEVEEISQAKADFRLKLEKQDPLESFCQDNPETDECRIYDH